MFIATETNFGPTPGGTGLGVWVVQGESRRVRHAGLMPHAAPFKLLLQRRGTACVRQGGRHTVLHGGEFTLIDGAQPFEIEMPQAFDQVLVALPRRAVLQRHGGLAAQTAVTRGVAADGGAGLLCEFVLALASHEARLSPVARLHGAAALVQLLGALEGSQAHDPRVALRRRALALMDLDIADTDAESLAAQLHVSRRYLDRAFAATGRSLSRQLWDRRLLLASERLAQAGPSVTAVAHSLGFKDSSHFSRLFRQQFGCTPSAWRAVRRGVRAE